MATVPIDGFRLDQDMRWSILVMAASHDLDGTEHRLEAEAVRDPSDRGERAALRAGAAWPDPGDEGQDVGLRPR